MIGYCNAYEWTGNGGGDMSHNYTKNFCFSENVHVFYIDFDLEDSGAVTQKDTKKQFYNELFNDITSFAFGTKEVMKRVKNPQDMTEIQREALEKMYQIKELRDAREYYLTSNVVEDKYLKRGEFGELILYHLLNEYFNSDSLISKIYFKDSAGLPAHGFDAVHIDVENHKLWIGESKLYEKSTSAIDELIKDLHEHFNREFFHSEFVTIQNRAINDLKLELDDFTKMIIDPKTKVLDRIAGINVALFAGFTSQNLSQKFKSHEELVGRLNSEIEILKRRADNKVAEHPWNQQLNIFLFLFPLDSKKDFVKDLHLKLKGARQL